MPGLRRRLQAVAVAVVALLSLGLAGCSTASTGDGGDRGAAVSAAKAFLREYVTPEGAVVRSDQGGDVVSEGQGYAMLLAYAIDDPQQFATIWSWTRTNLQRPDGLFAYHWQDGAVLDETPAADADTQIAWALALAGEAWSMPSDTAAARRIAGAIAETEIGYDDDGDPTLAAGPWAVHRGQPVQVEPGYWTFPAYDALADLTGDRRWHDLATTDAAHLADVTSGGSQLPPDWATLGASSGPEPVPAPQTGSPPASGQDGLRALIWASCEPSTHDLADDWWQAISATAKEGPLTRSLEGEPIAAGPSPLSLVAASAVAQVAGEDERADSLLRLADRATKDQPTYYGSAWNALGQVLLTTDLIPGCSP